MVRRKLNADEESLWQAFARNILPLRSRSASAPRARKTSAGASLEVTLSADQAAQSVSKPQKAGGQPVMASVRVREVFKVKVEATKSVRIQNRLEIDGRQPGLDTTSWNALASGKMKPQKRLDLHGHFAQDAFYKLHHFLHMASSQGIRCVEVITGLGSGQEGGVIRQELPHWLDRGDLRPLILAVVHTHKKNKGAVRILLRARNRV
ncbi:Smr/MutS family protein [Asaia astilbis]